MISAKPTRAIQALLAANSGAWIWGQVLIRRAEHAFQLRHDADRDQPEGQLRMVRLTELRTVVQNTAAGQYRPLKSAPNLVRGWQLLAANSGELETALNILNPGSVADWLAARQEPPPVTHFREFTERQSGMYRITAMLSDAQAAQVIRALCAPACCLKRRLWTVNGLAVDEPFSKSAIPCLEPCSVLLELGRKAMRIEQQPPLNLALHPDDAASAVAALEAALTESESSTRFAEVSATANPYRMRLVLEKLRDALALAHRVKSSEE